MQENTCREMDALDLLTEDCWKAVLQRVDSPRDLKSCSDACSIFEEILRKKRKEFMFSLILPHMLKYLPEYSPNEDEPVQPWNALLKCRLVCKTWCKSIDEHQEGSSHPHLFQFAYFFWSGPRIEQFLQTFATHGGNPFLGRSVVLPLRSPLHLSGNQAVQGLHENRDPGAEERALHARKLRQLLERFGREIWRAEVYELTTPNVHLAFCKNLLTVLLHSPNLRSLKTLHRFNFNTNNINAQLDQQREMPELTTYINANPLPDRPQLEHLEAPGIHVVMIRSLLEKYAPQLKSLLVSNPSGFPEEGLRLRNLRKLEFSCLDASTSLYCLRQLRSPLSSLGLRVICNRNDVYVWPIDKLFRNIQHLPIQRLELIIENVFLGESGPLPAEYRPHHGSISSVHLRFPAGSASLNFFLYCPMLHCMHLSRLSPREGIPAGHPDGIAESLDVNELLEQVGFDLYRSNVWENIPSLKCFTLGNYVGEHDDWNWRAYKRVEYEKMKLENGIGGAGE